MTGVFPAQEVNDGGVSNVSYEKGKRNQKGVKGTGVKPSAHVGFPLPRSFFPYDLLVRRSLLVKMLPAKTMIYSMCQKPYPLANNTFGFVWAMCILILIYQKCKYKKIQKNLHWLHNALTWTLELPRLLFPTDR